MVYKNTATGALLETDCEIQGENWEEAIVEETPIEKMSIAECKKYAEENNIDISDCKKVAEMREIILAINGDYENE
ncbi:MAG: hypothetical protein RSA49_05195 [Anaerovoracaceae bacterium]